jgi:hypothetical protein
VRLRVAVILGLVVIASGTATAAGVELQAPLSTERSYQQMLDVMLDAKAREQARERYLDSDAARTERDQMLGDPPNCRGDGKLCWDSGLLNLPPNRTPRTIYDAYKAKTNP